MSWTLLSCITLGSNTKHALYLALLSVDTPDQVTVHVDVAEDEPPTSVQEALGVFPVMILSRLPGQPCSDNPNNPCSHARCDIHTLIHAQRTPASTNTHLKTTIRCSMPRVPSRRGCLRAPPAGLLPHLPAAGVWAQVPGWPGPQAEGASPPGSGVFVAGRVHWNCGGQPA